MAVFESHFKELGFYAEGAFKKFKNGRYVTEDKAEIAALEKLGDVRKAAEAPAKPAEEKAKEPAPKPKRKAPAKSSDK